MILLYIVTFYYYHNIIKVCGMSYRSQLLTYLIFIPIRLDLKGTIESVLIYFIDSRILK